MFNIFIRLSAEFAIGKIFIKTLPSDILLSITNETFKLKKTIDTTSESAILFKNLFKSLNINYSFTKSFKVSKNPGNIFFQSPIAPNSASLNIFASTFLSIETICFELLHPAIC